MKPMSTIEEISLEKVNERRDKFIKKADDWVAAYATEDAPYIKTEDPKLAQIRMSIPAGFALAVYMRDGSESSAIEYVCRSSSGIYPTGNRTEFDEQKPLLVSTLIARIFDIGLVEYTLRSQVDSRNLFYAQVLSTNGIRNATDFEQYELRAVKLEAEQL